MMMTICKTLTELAEAGGRGSVRLPLDSDLYPLASCTAAAEAFSGLCRVRSLSGSRVEISLVDRSADGRRVIGELLNFMLGHTLRQRLEGERPGDGESA